MPPIAPLSPALARRLQEIVGPDNLIENGDSLVSLSRDFYWYSPVLRRQLDEKVAAAAVRVSTLEELQRTVAACWREKVPIVARGSGTGNYGQAVPLCGGVVIDMSRFDRILSLSSDGVVRAQPGARMGTIEAEARKAGWEFRCLPSTWVKSTVGGFICGGFGGIGSITWGPIAASGNVKSVTVLSCEENPRLLRFEEGDCRPALHAYGTTGILVEIEMRLAPRSDYAQLAFSSPRWDALLDWTDDTARNPAWHKRLVSQFEWPVPRFFKPLSRFFREDAHVTFVLVEEASADAVIASAVEAGIEEVFRSGLADPAKAPLLTDYTWNHTTLWAMKADPAYTYLQCGYGPDFRGQIESLRRRFPREILINLDWIAHQVKPGSEASGRIVGDPIRVGGLPLVPFISEPRLVEIMDYAASIGIRVGNPHVFTLEGGGDPDLPAKSRLKADLDPTGLLNPGKMATHPVNPFR